MEPMKPMAPMQPMSGGKPRWPAEFGQPSSSGSQDGTRYAFFADPHRLVVETGGRTVTYDTGDQRISGVAQSDGSVGPRFTSQNGEVDLTQLKQIG